MPHAKSTSHSPLSKSHAIISHALCMPSCVPRMVYHDCSIDPCSIYCGDVDAELCGEAGARRDPAVRPWPYVPGGSLRRSSVLRSTRPRAGIVAASQAARPYSAGPSVARAGALAWGWQKATARAISLVCRPEEGGSEARRGATSSRILSGLFCNFVVAASNMAFSRVFSA